MQPNKLYLVHYWYYEDSIACGVFSTEENAKQYVAIHSSSKLGDYTITEIEVDVPFEDTLF